MNLLNRIFGTKNDEDNQLDNEFERQLDEELQKENNNTMNNASFNNHSHPVFPGLNIEKHYKKISINLSEDGMNESIVRNGNPEHLDVLLTNVRSNYLDELEILKEAVRNDAINEMHQCDQDVINRNNKLRHIKENLIPETGLEVEDAKTEIGRLQERSTDEFEDLNSGFNTALISEIKKDILTFKKNIRELQSKSIGLESDVDQLENKKSQMRANIEAFEPYSRITLENKLSTYLNGWLKGLEMIAANQDLTTRANAIFNAFLNRLDEDNNQSPGLRRIA